MAIKAFVLEFQLNLSVIQTSYILHYLKLNKCYWRELNVNILDLYKNIIQYVDSKNKSNNNINIRMWVKAIITMFYVLYMYTMYVT